MTDTEADAAERARRMERYSVVVKKLNIEAEEADRGYLPLASATHISLILSKTTQKSAVHTFSDIGTLTEGIASTPGFLLTGQLTRGDHDFQVLFVINESTLSNPSLLLNLQRKRTLLHLSDSAQSLIQNIGKPPKQVFQVDHINAVPVYIVEPGLIPIIAKDTAISRTTKVASTVLSVFPWTRKDAPDVFHAVECEKVIPEISVPETIEQNSEEARTYKDEKLKDQFHDMVVSIGTYLLCYGYTGEDTVAGQIKRRLAAAYADANISEPDWDSYMKNIKEWAGVSSQTNGAVVELLGTVLALHKDGGISVSIATGEEANAAEDERLKDLPLIFNAIRDQMLLVFTNYQSATIRWALRALPLVEKLGFAGHRELKLEIAHLNSIKDEIEGRKYVGMVAKVAARHQQHNYPMMSLIGCQYHANHLESEEQRVAFQKFNMKGIGQRVADAQLRPVCDVIIKALPAPEIEAKTDLLREMSATDAEHFLGMSSEEEAEKIRARLRTISPPCPWAVQDAKEQAEISKRKYFEGAAIELRKRWEVANKSMVEKLTLEPDFEERKKVLREITELRNELEELLSEDEMTGVQLMKQLGIKERPDLEKHWDRGMAIIRKLRGM